MLCRLRRLLGLALGLTWFPSYLAKGLGFTQETAARIATLPWIFGFFVVITGGYISQRLKSAGMSSRASRGVLAGITLVVGGCTLPFVGAMPAPALKIATLVFGAAIGSTIYVVIPMIVSELTPQPQRAGMLAIVNSVITSPGVLAPLVMGSVIQSAATPLAGYEQGYIILGCLLITGGAIGLLFIRPEADRKRLAANAVPVVSVAAPRAPEGHPAPAITPRG